MTSITMETATRIIGPLPISIHDLHNPLCLAGKITDEVDRRISERGEDELTADEINRATIEIDETRAEGLGIDSDAIKRLMCEMIAP